MEDAVKAYLDTNVVSAIGRNDTPTETDALDRLLAANEQGKVDLVTSELTLGEIKTLNHQDRIMLERIYRLFKKVPIMSWSKLLGINVYMDKYTCTNSPMIETDVLYVSLLKLYLKPVDAQHLFVAAKQSCGYFLTFDRGVLSRASSIQQLCGVIVQKPSGLATSQGW